MIIRSPAYLAVAPILAVSFYCSSTLGQEGDRAQKELEEFRTRLAALEEAVQKEWKTLRAKVKPSVDLDKMPDRDLKKQIQTLREFQKLKAAGKIGAAYDRFVHNHIKTQMLRRALRSLPRKEQLMLYPREVGACLKALRPQLLEKAKRGDAKIDAKTEWNEYLLRTNKKYAQLARKQYVELWKSPRSGGMRKVLATLAQLLSKPGWRTEIEARQSIDIGFSTRFSHEFGAIELGYVNGAWLVYDFDGA